MRFEHGPSDRMQVVGQGDLRFPGTCMHCGGASCDEGYVELDVKYDYEGDMYLCMTCVHQMVELVGSVHPDDFITIMGEKAKLQYDLNLTSERLEEANERLATYDSLFSSVNTNDVTSSSNPPVVSVEGERQDGSPDEQLELPINDGESESKEPVKVGGPDDFNGDESSHRTTKRSFKL